MKHECLQSKRFCVRFFGNVLLVKDECSSYRWKGETSFESYCRLDSILKKTFTNVLIKDHLANFFLFRLVEQLYVLINKVLRCSHLSYFNLSHI